jgi:polysaccharide export outer membrane protein
VQAGDLINVQVWDNDKLSSRGRVRSDGRISVPLLNDVAVAGKTPEEIAKEVEQRLASGNLVLRPRVTVLVEEAQPVTVSVLGKVARAGTLQLASGAGVAEALAGAGGLTEFAHEDRIFVLRRTPDPIRVRFTFGSLTDLSRRAVGF